MNLLTLWGLVLGLVLVLVYVGCAHHKKKKKPDLAAAAGILIAAVGACGAIRLIGFVFTDAFSKAVASSEHGSLWGLSSDDGVFIVIGGLALGWVSCQATWQIFADLDESD